LLEKCSFGLEIIFNMNKAIKNFFKRILNRPQPEESFLVCVKMGIKAFITISCLSAIGHFSGQPLIIAPFAASCITIYTAPKEEFAQPMNVIGGYLIASFIGILAIILLPHQWWILGLVLLITISAMAYLRVTHPPAGSIPFVIFFYHPFDALYEVLIPAIVGSFGVVIMALILNNIPFAKREYPRKL